MMSLSDINIGWTSRVMCVICLEKHDTNPEREDYPFRHSSTSTLRKGTPPRARLGDGRPLESSGWAGSLVVAQVLFHFELRPEQILTGRQVKVTAPVSQSPPPFTDRLKTIFPLRLLGQSDNWMVRGPTRSVRGLSLECRTSKLYRELSPRN